MSDNRFQVMTKIKLEEYAKMNCINLNGLGIALGYFSHTPGMVGCCEENGLWYMYTVNEYGDPVIIETGTEECVMTELFLEYVVKSKPRKKKTKFNMKFWTKLRKS